MRLILIVIGIGIVVSIYIWGTIQARKRQRQQTVRQRSSGQDIAGLKMVSTVDTEVDYTSVLAGLSQSISRSREVAAATVSVQKELDDSAPVTVEEHEKADAAQTSIQQLSTQASARAGEDSKAMAAANLPTSLIITLHILPRANEVFSGHRILEILNQLELRFGAMDIFHHYGVGEMKVDQPLFSLANMVEPGSFDIKQMDTATVRGLVVFMCLPAAIDGLLIFELMLNTAQRLADSLNGEVCDENRLLISEQKIESIRDQIENVKEKHP